MALAHGQCSRKGSTSMWCQMSRMLQQALGQHCGHVVTLYIVSYMLLVLLLLPPDHLHFRSALQP
jgi:hypothetical protein